MNAILLKKISILIVVLMITLTYSYAQEATKIRLIRNLPIVQGQINGKIASFIIDTGSSVTILNESMAKDFGFIVVENPYFEKYHIVGLGGKCNIYEAKRVEVNFGGHYLEFINKACPLEKISRTFAYDKVKIAGIIGTDVLSFLGSHINFADTTIVFHPKPVESVKPLKPFITRKN